MGDMLLAVLQSGAGLTYMSDLTVRQNRKAVYRVIRNMKQTCYTLDEWSYVMSYITGSPCKIESYGALADTVKPSLFV